MAKQYPWCEAIDLFVAERIGRADAMRQERTAREILHRFERQPGIVLADEVGMGKTFVALAVAVSVALSDRERRPVVVMVPAALKEKWPKDYAVFREHCLPDAVGARLRIATAERPVEFLKLLDDPLARRCSLIFVTHGAMSRALFDKWTKLAIIYRAVKGRWCGDRLRRRLARFLPKLLRMESASRDWPEALWFELLKNNPGTWLRRLQRYRIDPEGHGAREEADDPVPKAILDVLGKLDTGQIYEALTAVPAHRSKHLERRLQRVREAMREPLQEVWRHAVMNMSLRLPLVVLDEAHHLKNSQTRLASLFQNKAAQADVDEITRGALGGVFERMLFLTATPFQLGHHELCSVLERFDGIAWRTTRAPALSRESFTAELRMLRARLDAAQLAAAKLDHAWGQLRRDDLVADGRRYSSAAAWWARLAPTSRRATAADSSALTGAGRAVVRSCQEAAARLADANEALRPWVIRHAKPRTLPSDGGAQVERRRRFPGLSVVDEDQAQDERGLRLDEGALLPFLLAARATTCQAECRPVFAEGLASSYEAFLDTRRQTRSGMAATDGDDEHDRIAEVDDAAAWYLDQLESLVRPGRSGGAGEHPKVGVTVEKVVDLWRRGEKVLVFCHYVATGRVLRQRISRALDREIMRLGAKRLGCPPEDVHRRLAVIGDRLSRGDSSLRRSVDGELYRLVRRYPALTEQAERLVAVVRRFLRTPSFLVRGGLLDGGELDAAAFAEAIASPDASGLSLRDLIEGFLEFLTQRCTAEERVAYIDALSNVQTGTHRGDDIAQAFSDDELQGAPSEQLLPNVRLVNGASRQETRQKLMLTFNTPFYPEVLVSSRVLAEGVDLHLSCRHVIHHDLCWNPSTLEQRTGRIDRIGAKCERARHPIHIYLPYLAETQDEKMYRVVMDRERWFQVVMGENYRVAARATDRMAERLELPEAIVEALLLRLEVAEAPRGRR